jgi:hypothetical protein
MCYMFAGTGMGRADEMPRKKVSKSRSEETYNQYWSRIALEDNRVEIQAGMRATHILFVGLHGLSLGTTFGEHESTLSVLPYGCEYAWSDVRGVEFPVGTSHTALTQSVGRTGRLPMVSGCTKNQCWVQVPFSLIEDSKGDALHGKGRKSALLDREHCHDQHRRAFA